MTEFILFATGGIALALIPFLILKALDLKTRPGGYAETNFLRFSYPLVEQIVCGILPVAIIGFFFLVVPLSDNEHIWIAYIFCSVFLAGGLFCQCLLIAVRTEIPLDGRGCFYVRTFFFKLHTIVYEDCIGFQIGAGDVTVFTEKRKFRIDCCHEELHSLLLHFESYGVRMISLTKKK